MTAKRTNGAHSANEATLPAAMFALTPAAAASSFRASQKLALEAARFWARRMHAYAEQFETLASCTQPNDVVAAQARFITRMQEDYAAEREAITTIWSSQQAEANEEADRA